MKNPKISPVMRGIVESKHESGSSISSAVRHYWITFEGGCTHEAGEPKTSIFVSKQDFDKIQTNMAVIVHLEIED